MPRGPRCTATGGTTTALCLVSTRSRTVTKAPGHSAVRWLGNIAFSLMVPVAGSTWLSITVSTPRSSGARSAAAGVPDCGRAITSGPRSPAAAIAAETAARFCCGSVNSTAIGFSVVITTSPAASEACTTLPASTWRMPTRPATGARTVV